MGDTRRIQRVAQLINELQAKEPVVVVVSAIGGVTDLLLTAATAAAGKNQSKLTESLKSLRGLHLQVAAGLKLTQSAQTELNDLVDERLAKAGQLLQSVYTLGELTPRALDAILSYGERLNIHLVANAIGPKARPLEASNFIVTDDRFGAAQPQLEKSVRRTKLVISPLIKRNFIPVVTGYIGATAEGVITTLGRGGSDYSATILGYCLGAREVWIWTDVDGVMTADPKVVRDAHTIAELTYNEAAELSYFGAKVLHPLTMVPVALKNIPIRIKNTFKPEIEGTKIAKKISENGTSTKAIATIGNLSLITVQGKGMLGVPGVAARMFDAIAAEEINVMFISQASSEFNISFVVQYGDGRHAVKVLKEIFRYELDIRTIETVKIEENLAIIAVVGEGMRGHPGIAGQTFSALGNAKVNIIAIAQGSSERNISLVIHQHEVPKAVKSIHNQFHLAKKQNG